MPKQRTRKTISKRFKVTARRILLRKQARTSHLKRKDSSSAKFRKKRLSRVTTAFAKKLIKVI